jgi:hypothetical protein
MLREQIVLWQNKEILQSPEKNYVQENIEASRRVLKQSREMAPYVDESVKSSRILSHGGSQTSLKQYSQVASSRASGGPSSSGRPLFSDAMLKLQ